MNEINELLDRLSEAVKENFPGYTDANFTINPNGKISVDILKWDEHKKLPVENRKRKYLASYSKREDGSIGADISYTMNSYMKEIGVLLEG